MARRLVVERLISNVAMRRNRQSSGWLSVNTGPQADEAQRIAHDVEATRHAGLADAELIQPTAKHRDTGLSTANTGT